MTRQQRLKLKDFAADGTGEGLGRRAPSACSCVHSIADFDLQVNAYVVLLKAGGSLEAAQTDATAVRFVAAVDAAVSGEQGL